MRQWAYASPGFRASARRYSASASAVLFSSGEDVAVHERAACGVECGDLPDLLLRLVHSAAREAGRVRVELDEVAAGVYALRVERDGALEPALHFFAQPIRVKSGARIAFCP